MELLIATTIGLLVIGFSLALVLNSRALYTKDTARTSINDNLRAGLDIINADIRQAGERLPATVPALQVIQGAGGAADTLAVRRNLLDSVLNVCNSMLKNTNTTTISVTTIGILGTSANPLCGPNTADLSAWKTYRTAQGGTVRAYLYNPSTRTGEFFDYTDETVSLGVLKRPVGKWANDYPATAQPRLYLMEERRYTLDTTTGDLTVNVGQVPDEQTMHVVAGITGFQVTPYLNSTTGISAVTGDFGLNTTDDWSKVAYVDVAMTGKQTQNNSSVTRTLNDRPVPRNAASN